MIIHVNMNETLSYFIDTKDRELDYTAMKSFLIAKYTAAPDYWKEVVEEGLIACELLNQTHYGFPILGGGLTGASRSVIVKGEKYMISLSVIDIEPLEE